MTLNFSQLPSDQGAFGENHSRITLKVGGEDYKFWKRVSISRSLTQISGEFNFTSSNLYGGDQGKWAIYMGSEAVVELEGTPIITGYIDEVDVSYDKGSYEIQFKGRDKTSDLVDCSFDFNEGKNEFLNLTGLQILERLCKPFDITPKIDIDTTNQSDSILGDLSNQIDKFTVDPGEKVFEQVAEICQQFAVMPVSFGDGFLYLTRAGDIQLNDQLEGGVNILSARLSQSDRERFSTYYTKGIPRDTTFKDKPLAVGGKLEDEYITRHRPLVVNIGKAGISDDICQTRAAWEARIRAGSSRQVEILTQGWSQSNGEIWPLNGLVRYKDKYIGIDAEYLISAIEMTLDDSGGELTNMTLVSPDTFKLEKRTPIPETAETAFDKNRKTQKGAIDNSGRGDR